MPATTLNVHYRPIRTGFCLRSGDLDSLAYAFDLAVTVCGGRFCPILPVDDPKYCDEVIHALRLDALYAMSDDPLVKEFVEARDFIRWPFIVKNFLDADLKPQLLSVAHQL